MFQDSRSPVQQSGFEQKACLELWKECVKTENVFFTTDGNYTSEKMIDMYWWPFSYNGKILVSLYDSEGSTEFLKWFAVLASYPIEFDIGHDVDIAVDILLSFPKDDASVDALFALLIKRNSRYYEYKQRWLKGT